MESMIGREKAKQILEGIGGSDLYSEDGTYYIVQSRGKEYLWEYGYDTPLAVNTGSISWTGRLPSQLNGVIVTDR